MYPSLFFFNDTATTEIYTLSLHDALPISLTEETYNNFRQDVAALGCLQPSVEPRATEHIAEMKSLIERLVDRSEEHTSELQSHVNLVCRLLLEKKKKKKKR